MNYSSALLSTPQAAPYMEGEVPEFAGVAWHYGDPLSEQRNFDRGGGIVDRSNRAVLKVAGPDAATFLNNLLSQKLSDESQAGTWALDLDPQGRVLHYAGVIAHEGAFFLDVSPRGVDSLQSYLEKMVFWSKVEISRTHLALLTLVSAAPLPQMEDFALRREYTLAGYHCVDVLVEDLEQAAATLQRDLGVKLTGLMAYTALRVRAVEPEVGLDLDEKSIPHESWRLLHNAVHLNKGCYRGQETVARVENLGRSPRVLALAHLDGSAPELPPIGTEILAGGRGVGRVGTVVHDFELGPIALVLLKRSAVGADTGVGAGADLRAGNGDVALMLDRDSLPPETEQAGRKAQETLRGK
ncbi:folate-binding protein [Corynebacterium sp. 153RC1]|uniref:CAF17-like 4Fe-4S cluster assembly/insertion protein YgfZ n=1 Tax=unclassified Corynebacterium TaxID=2624378 RepID=UPI00211BD430|nr:MULTISPECIES: folate-binding protein [unclassified Corynebacterium]MCQ9353134.1 folate-binding protein [Corynebacterium sp. 209RC1]MCQ9355338.1 folate-binding protein [Corynebacterium sp. 1222RC1]MCQ9357720.1 folate-binding protein [Corynebacterium sp. 122RC1]MCQ9359168.1 folate-binding protein [Corynebacterium sp. 142RC1]MCQ9361872.1 folate-binding protein [Corynebacterium sp. 153RC1]